MTDAHASSAAGEFVLESPHLREFIGYVEKIRAHESEPRAIFAAIRPHFADLLADKEWLPDQYQELAPEGGMGRNIGMWLLYRASDGGLALSSLVIPPGVETPVHDHLAWGLVGLYRGTQDEDVFARQDNGADEERAILNVSEQHSLAPGDFYELLPENDIHRVRTTSEVTSVSLHLLGNDNGCIWRHRYDPEAGTVEPFRSGYVNVPCESMIEPPSVAPADAVTRHD